MAKFQERYVCSTLEIARTTEIPENINSAIVRPSEIYRTCAS